MKRPVAGLLVVAALLTIAAPAAAPVPAGGSARADRVLIVSLPHVSWEELAEVELPNLEAFFADAGIADLAVRATPVGLSGRPTRLGDGYVTLGAGTRAIGDAGATDGQGFDVHESFPPDSAGEVYQRRTGRVAERGLVQLGIAQIDAKNADLPLDAEPGALGEALAAAGYSRAVIANGDGMEPEGEPPAFRRSAVSALMSPVGKVPAGRVDDGLLEPDANAPYGLRFDNRAVAAAFRNVWEPRSVVLVEASDLVRADAYRHLATDDQRKVLLAEALQRTDQLFGELLADVDLDRDAVMVVGPAYSASETTLTVAALHAPGTEAGLLRSATTRRAGFVQLVDVAPTVLDVLGVDRPDSMAGRPFEVGDRGGSYDNRVDTLIESDQAARFIADQVEPVGIAFVTAHALLLVATVLWLTSRFAGVFTVSRLQYAALALLGAIPAVFLARLVPFHDLGALAYWCFVVAVAIVLGGIYLAAGRRTSLDPLILATGAVVGLLAVDVVFGSRLQISSALGNSPIIAGRFTGFGNLAFAAIAASGLILATLLAERMAGRRGLWAAAGCLGFVVVVDGMPFWGADVGGVLSMAPAFLVMVILLFGWQLRLRTVAFAVVAAAVAVTGFGLLDLARDADQRTHLGRLFETASDQGWSGVATVLERKLTANIASFSETLWTFGVVIAIVFFIWLVRFAPAELRSVVTRHPLLRPAAISAAVLLVLGLAVNDSGIRVPAFMLVVFDASLIFLMTADRRRAAPVALPREAEAVAV